MGGYQRETHLPRARKRQRSDRQLVQNTEWGADLKLRVFNGALGASESQEAEQEDNEESAASALMQMYAGALPRPAPSNIGADRHQLSGKGNARLGQLMAYDPERALKDQFSNESGTSAASQVRVPAPLILEPADGFAPRLGGHRKGHRLGQRLGNPKIQSSKPDELEARRAPPAPQTLSRSAPLDANRQATAAPAQQSAGPSRSGQNMAAVPRWNPEAASHAPPQPAVPAPLSSQSQPPAQEKPPETQLKPGRVFKVFKDRPQGPMQSRQRAPRGSAPRSKPNRQYQTIQLQMAQPASKKALPPRPAAPKQQSGPALANIVNNRGGNLQILLHTPIRLSVPTSMPPSAPPSIRVEAPQEAKRGASQAGGSVQPQSDANQAEPAQRHSQVGTLKSSVLRPADFGDRQDSDGTDNKPKKPIVYGHDLLEMGVYRALNPSVITTGHFVQPEPPTTSA